MKLLKLKLACIALLLGLLNAQTENATVTVTQNKFWEAQLAGGEYTVKLDRITSVSRHTYLVGNMLVSEVVIDTEGNSLARFYSSTPFEGGITEGVTDRIQEVLGQKADAVGIEATPVVKTFPDSTHAKTVEYSLKSTGAVTALYNSIRKAWRSNREAKFTSK